MSMNVALCDILPGIIRLKKMSVLKKNYHLNYIPKLKMFYRCWKHGEGRPGKHQDAQSVATEVPGAQSLV